ncbi:winged helix domain-containing protein [Sinorhizobium fredii]|uniref:winged helix domain-containing protein n=1 Tax=Rhizobium fredii TaxID=380 RepID=UPI0035161A6B
MTTHAKAQYSMRVQIMDKGEPVGLPMTIVGRDAWMLQGLIKAGKAGCTSIDNPAPRISHYIFKLRGFGIAIETVHESHSGPFPGSHARYFLRSDLVVLDEKGLAA